MKCLECGREIGTQFGVCRECYLRKERLAADSRRYRSNSPARLSAKSLSFLFVALICFGSAVLILYDLLSDSPPPDNLIAQGPVQREASVRTPWKHAEYDISPVADLFIEARVLSITHFWFDKASNVSPMDMLLAWGSMSQGTNISAFRFVHIGRFFSFHPLDPHSTIPESFIYSTVMNLHLIPSDEVTGKKLNLIKEGRVIRLEGQLVDVSSPNGFQWKSSNSLSEINPATNRVYWVNKVKIVEASTKQ